MQDFLDEYKSRSRGLQSFDISTRRLLERLECKYSCLLRLHLVVWWPIKAGCIHRPAELRAPSNNVDPSVPPLLSMHFTICGEVNYCSNRDYLYFIKDPLRMMPKVSSIPLSVAENTISRRCSSNTFDSDAI